MLRFRCPHCQQPNQQTDEQAGQVVCCQSCGKRLRAPQKRRNQAEAGSPDVSPQQRSKDSQRKPSRLENGEVDWSQLADMEKSAAASEEVETFELRQPKHSQTREKPNEVTDNDPNKDVDSSYTPSGRVGLFSIILMPIGGVVTAGITLVCYSLAMGLLGAAFGFTAAGIQLEFVPRMLGTLGARFCFWASLPCFLGTFALPTAGTMLSSRLSKNRNRIFAALTAGATVLLVLAVLVIHNDPEAAAQQIEAMTPTDQPATPPNVLAFIVRYHRWIEVPAFILFALVAAGVAAVQIGEQYFCEKCKKYLNEPKCHYWSLGAAEIVSKPLRQKDIPAVLQAMRSQPKLLTGIDGECARMEIRSCPNCGQAVVNVFDVIVVDVVGEGEKVLNETRRASVWVSKKDARQLKSPHSVETVPSHEI